MTTKKHKILMYHNKKQTTPMKIIYLKINNKIVSHLYNSNSIIKGRIQLMKKQMKLLIIVLDNKNQSCKMQSNKCLNTIKKDYK